MGISIGTIGSIGVGVCPNHPVPIPYTTVIDSGEPLIKANGKPVATIGSTGICTCGHPTIAITGSPAVLSNQKGQHKIGDTGINYGSYTLTTGEPSILSD